MTNQIGESKWPISLVAYGKVQVLEFGRTGRVQDEVQFVEIVLEEASVVEHGLLHERSKLDEAGLEQPPVLADQHVHQT